MTTSASICPLCGSRLVPANLFANGNTGQTVLYWCTGREGAPCAYSEWRMTLTSTAKQEQAEQGS